MARIANNARRAHIQPSLVLLLTGLVALSGCGKDDDPAASSSASTEASASPAATPSATPTAPAGTGLDAAFGTNGVAKVPLSADSRDRLNAIAVGPDGKLYAAGLTSKGTDQEFAVARFDTDGKPDASFGTNGVASVNVSANAKPEPSAQLEQARSVVVMPDGKVVAVGTAEHDGAATGDAAKDTDVIAVRFDSAGKPDTAFGSGGIARLDLGAGHAVDAETYAGADQGYGSAALPDGGLVIMGVTTAGSDRPDADWALVGLDGSGRLDKDFGTDGVVKIDHESGNESARHVRVVNDKIIATGYTRGADDVVKPALIRTSLTGQRDGSFGSNGVAVNKLLGAVAESYQFGVQGDKYVLTGYGKDAEADKVDLVAYRFTSTGALDTTFGTNGVTKIDNVGEDDRGRNLAVLPDGRILYVGSGKVDKDNQQAMAVLLGRDGAPEAGFGTDGKLMTDLGSNGDAWFGIALSPDGRTAYLAGFTNVSSDDVKGDDAHLGRIKLP
jgi:uncharacterized delta-60 repeat protein